MILSNWNVSLWKSLWIINNSFVLKYRIEIFCLRRQQITNIHHHHLIINFTIFLNFSLYILVIEFFKIHQNWELSLKIPQARQRDYKKHLKFLLCAKQKFCFVQLKYVYLNLLLWKPFHVSVNFLVTSGAKSGIQKT